LEIVNIFKKEIKVLSVFATLSFFSWVLCKKLIRPEVRAFVSLACHKFSSQINVFVYLVTNEYYSALNVWVYIIIFYINIHKVGLNQVQNFAEYW